MRLLRRTSTITLLALVCITASASATNRHGVQRNYAGAGWANTNDVVGWHSTLTLDRARRRDDGFIAETMWAATDGKKTAFGRNKKKTPYVQISVSSGYKGKAGMYIVGSARNTSGEYFEAQSPGPAVQLGKPYTFTMSSDVASDGGKNGWGVSLGAESIGHFNNTGDDFRSHSVFGGIESSSKRNSASGSVTDMYRTIISGKAAAPFPCWESDTGSDVGAELSKRGSGAKASWTKRHCSIRNSFGR